MSNSREPRQALGVCVRNQTIKRHARVYVAPKLFSKHHGRVELKTARRAVYAPWKRGPLCAAVNGPGVRA